MNKKKSKVIYAVVDEEYYPTWELEEDLDFLEGFIDGGRDFIGYKAEEIAHWRKLFNDSWGLSFEEVFDSFTYWGVNITNEEIEQLIAIYDSRGSSESQREEEFILACLKISHQHEYKKVAIRGCCQGDYAELYIPADVEYNQIRYIEALYFNTGTAIVIHDEPGVPKSPDKVRGYTTYTDAYSDEDLKAFVRKCSGEQDATVVLWTIRGYKRVPIYERV